MASVGTTKRTTTAPPLLSSSPTTAVVRRASSSSPLQHRHYNHDSRRRVRRRTCSLLAVAGSAAAYLSLYGLILLGRFGSDDSANAARRAGHRRPVQRDSHPRPTTTERLDDGAGAVVPKPGLRSPAKELPVQLISKKDDNGKSTTAKRKNAYSYLVAGCDPNHPQKYRAYLLGVAVSMHALQSHGSTSDFHVFVELLHGSNHTKLLPDEESLLTRIGATIHYIPTDPQQSFYRSQLFKFLILNLTQHNHVFYLDSDVLPLSNLDYLFDAMDKGALRRNVAFLGKQEPANGGSFILSPRIGALEVAHQLIARKERQQQHRSWNSTVGWGVDAASVREFAFPTSVVGTQSTWNFFGADGDQGFLYYWMKFVERDVTFVSTSGALWHWGPWSPEEDRGGGVTPPQQQEQQQQPQVVYGRNALPPVAITSESDASLLPVFLWTEPNAQASFEAAGIKLPPGVCFPANKFCAGQKRPRRDFFHFTGDRKPWVLGLPEDYGPDTRRASIDHYWFSLLEELNEHHGLGLDFAREGGPLAPLSTFSEAVGADAIGGDAGDTSRYEMRYKQKSGPHQVYTRLIRDSDHKHLDSGPIRRTGPQASDSRGASRNAYSFLIGACDPDRPSKYRYFLYSVMVIVRVLQTAGSTADFHVWIEMFHMSSHDRLPDDEARVLREMGVAVHYIGGKRPGQSFYGLQLQKFRVLGLLQYKHVMYLDSDIIPIVNLDFMFDWIDEGILKANVGFVGNTEPMNGGAFVLSPRAGAVEQVNELIYQKEHRPWSSTEGWGHVLTPPDRYLTNFVGPQTTWDFHGGDTDQGLLYYWTKYVEKDVSMILKNFTVEHWGAPTSLSNENVVPVPSADFAKSYLGRLPPRIPACYVSEKWCGAATAFIHLTGKAKNQRKPWIRGLPVDYNNETKYSSVYHFWFAVLEEINVQHRLGIDLQKTFGAKLPESATILEGYNDAFKQKRVDAFTSIVD